MVDDWDFEAIEMAVRRKAMGVAARAVEQRINADTFDYAGPTVEVLGASSQRDTPAGTTKHSRVCWGR